MNTKETFFEPKKPTIEIQFAVRCYVASVCSFDTLKLKSKIMEEMEADRVANRTRKKRYSKYTHRHPHIVYKG